MNCSSGQNILNEVKNWKKIGEDYDTLICSFLYFLISVVKVLLWRLCTGLCLYPDLRFFIVKKFVSWKNLGQNHTSSLPTISLRQVIAPGRTASKSPPLSPKQQSMYAIPICISPWLKENFSNLWCSDYRKIHLQVTKLNLTILPMFVWAKSCRF